MDHCEDVHMVRHDDPRIEAVTDTVEVSPIRNDHLGHIAATEEAAPEAPIEHGMNACPRPIATLSRHRSRQSVSLSIRDQLNDGATVEVRQVAAVAPSRR
jgi:hypothetical protein